MSAPRRSPALPRDRRLTVVAQDPSIPGVDHDVLLSEVYLPAEELRVGPWGYRVQTVDFNVTTGKSYQGLRFSARQDPLHGVGRDRLLDDPRLHSINAYALVMRTLSRFERALGRRVSWGFYGHHLNVVPHAFLEANAFYSRDDHALLFGYFPSSAGGLVFTCLSHDIVVHETTHALLDGLRPRFLHPSSADQAAFHEGFADVVALLSVFSLPGVAAAVLRHAFAGHSQKELLEQAQMMPEADARAVETADWQSGRDNLLNSALLGLAEEVGSEIRSIRGDALRRSVQLPPSAEYYAAKKGPWAESHRRGEILVAAVLNAFVDSWLQALKHVTSTGPASRELMAAEGARVADVLLTMIVRAIDYTPPVHLEFPDFLSALLTIDTELRPKDNKSRYSLRSHLSRSFAAYGILPASRPTTDGCWRPPGQALEYRRSHHQQLRVEPDEVFRFIWENKTALKLNEQAYSRVLSVRPTVRVGSDGFVLNEVVVEHLETLKVLAKDLGTVRDPDTGREITKPRGMPDDLEIKLEGGAAMIFDDYGQLKYHIHNGVDNAAKQTDRLECLWKSGYRFDRRMRPNFDAIHRRRGHGNADSAEAW